VVVDVPSSVWVVGQICFVVGQEEWVVVAVAVVLWE